MPTCPTAQLKPHADKKLRNAYLWVFRDELTGVTGAPEAGAVVRVVDSEGASVGLGWYSTASHIAVRMLTTQPRQAVDAALLRERLRAAVARRASITGTNARRLVYAEADGLPGIIVDQYDRWLVLQLRHPGAEPWRKTLVQELRKLCHPAGILERSDMPARTKEGLPPVQQVLDGEVPARLQITEDGLRFWVDVRGGRKTGFYLDQRQARRTLHAWVQPRQHVLDLFAYTGAFSVVAAARGASTLGVELTESHLALAREQAQLNGVAERMEFVAGDAFTWLETAASGGRRFDVVILDPPGLAKTAPEVPAARRRAQRMFTHAMRLVAPDGLLLASLCTYHLLPFFHELVRIAAFETQRRVWVLDEINQAPDHPWLLQHPETLYLKSLLLRVGV